MVHTLNEMYANVNNKSINTEHTVSKSRFQEDPFDEFTELALSSNVKQKSTQNVEAMARALYGYMKKNFQKNSKHVVDKLRARLLHLFKYYCQVYDVLHEWLKDLIVLYVQSELHCRGRIVDSVNRIKNVLLPIFSRLYISAKGTYDTNAILQKIIEFLKYELPYNMPEIYYKYLIKEIELGIVSPEYNSRHIGFFHSHELIKRKKTSSSSGIKRCISDANVVIGSFKQFKDFALKDDLGFSAECMDKKAISAGPVEIFVPEVEIIDLTKNEIDEVLDRLKDVCSELEKLTEKKVIFTLENEASNIKEFSSQLQKQQTKTPRIKRKQRRYRSHSVNEIDCIEAHGGECGNKVDFSATFPKATNMKSVATATSENEIESGPENSVTSIIPIESTPIDVAIQCELLHANAENASRGIQVETNVSLSDKAIQVDPPVKESSELTSQRVTGNVLPFVPIKKTETTEDGIAAILTAAALVESKKSPRKNALEAALESPLNLSKKTPTKIKPSKGPHYYSGHDTSVVTYLPEGSSNSENGTDSSDSEINLKRATTDSSKIIVKKKNDDEDDDDDDDTPLARRKRKSYKDPNFPSSKNVVKSPDAANVYTLRSHSTSCDTGNTVKEERAIKGTRRIVRSKSATEASKRPETKSTPHKKRFSDLLRKLEDGVVEELSDSGDTTFTFDTSTIETIVKPHILNELKNEQYDIKEDTISHVAKVIAVSFKRKVQAKTKGITKISSLKRVRPNNLRKKHSKGFVDNNSSNLTKGNGPSNRGNISSATLHRNYRNKLVKNNLEAALKEAANADIASVQHPNEDIHNSSNIKKCENVSDSQLEIKIDVLLPDTQIHNPVIEYAEVLSYALSDPSTDQISVPNANSVNVVVKEDKPLSPTIISQQINVIDTFKPDKGDNTLNAESKNGDKCLTKGGIVPIIDNTSENMSTAAHETEVQNNKEPNILSSGIFSEPKVVSKETSMEICEDNLNAQEIDTTASANLNLSNKDSSIRDVPVTIGNKPDNLKSELKSEEAEIVKEKEKEPNETLFEEEEYIENTEGQQQNGNSFEKNRMEIIKIKVANAATPEDENDTLSKNENENLENSDTSNTELQGEQPNNTLVEKDNQVKAAIANAEEIEQQEDTLSAKDHIEMNVDLVTSTTGAVEKGQIDTLLEKDTITMVKGEIATIEVSRDDQNNTLTEKSNVQIEKKGTSNIVLTGDGQNNTLMEKSNIEFIKVTNEGKHQEETLFERNNFKTDIEKGTTDNKVAEKDTISTEHPQKYYFIDNNKVVQKQMTNVETTENCQGYTMLERESTNPEVVEEDLTEVNEFETGLENTEVAGKEESEVLLPIDIQEDTLVEPNENEVGKEGTTSAEIRNVRHDDTMLENIKTEMAKGELARITVQEEFERDIVSEVNGIETGIGNTNVSGKQLDETLLATRVDKVTANSHITAELQEDNFIEQNDNGVVKEGIANVEIGEQCQDDTRLTTNPAVAKECEDALSEKNNIKMYSEAEKVNLEITEQPNKTLFKKSNIKEIGKLTNTELVEERNIPGNKIDVEIVKDLGIANIVAQDQLDTPASNTNVFPREAIIKSEVPVSNGEENASIELHELNCFIDIPSERHLDNESHPSGYENRASKNSQTEMNNIIGGGCVEDSESRTTERNILGVVESEKELTQTQFLPLEISSKNQVVNHCINQPNESLPKEKHENSIVEQNFTNIIQQSDPKIDAHKLGELQHARDIGHTIANQQCESFLGINQSFEPYKETPVPSTESSMVEHQISNITDKAGNFNFDHICFEETPSVAMYTEVWAASLGFSGNESENLDDSHISFITDREFDDDSETKLENPSQKDDESEYSKAIATDSETDSIDSFLTNEFFNLLSKNENINTKADSHVLPNTSNVSNDSIKKSHNKKLSNSSRIDENNLYKMTLRKKANTISEIKNMTNDTSGRQTTKKPKGKQDRMNLYKQETPYITKFPRNPIQKPYKRLGCTNIDEVASKAKKVKMSQDDTRRENTKEETTNKHYIQSVTRNINNSGTKPGPIRKLFAPYESTITEEKRDTSVKHTYQIKGDSNSNSEKLTLNPTQNDLTGRRCTTQQRKRRMAINEIEITKIPRLAKTKLNGKEGNFNIPPPDDATRATTRNVIVEKICSDVDNINYLPHEGLTTQFRNIPAILRKSTGQRNSNAKQMQQIKSESFEAKQMQQNKSESFQPAATSAFRDTLENLLKEAAIDKTATNKLPASRHFIQNVCANKQKTKKIKLVENIASKHTEITSPACTKLTLSNDEDQLREADFNKHDHLQQKPVKTDPPKSQNEFYNQTSYSDDSNNYQETQNLRECYDTNKEQNATLVDGFDINPPNFHGKCVFVNATKTEHGIEPNSKPFAIQTNFESVLFDNEWLEPIPISNSTLIEDVRNQTQPTNSNLETTSMDHSYTFPKYSTPKREYIEQSSQETNNTPKDVFFYEKDPWKGNFEQPTTDMLSFDTWQTSDVDVDMTSIWQEPTTQNPTRSLPYLEEFLDEETTVTDKRKPTDSCRQQNQTRQTPDDDGVSETILQQPKTQTSSSLSPGDKVPAMKKKKSKRRSNQRKTNAGYGEASEYYVRKTRSVTEKLREKFPDGIDAFDRFRETNNLDGKQQESSSTEDDDNEEGSSGNLFPEPKGGDTSWIRDIDKQLKR